MIEYGDDNWVYRGGFYLVEECGVRGWENEIWSIGI